MKVKLLTTLFVLLLTPCLLVAAPGGKNRFVDNGNGTITDKQTGLMWEKKDAADGVEHLSNPHDVDNGYTWTATPGDVLYPDGTLFTDFLIRLNSSTDDPSMVGFAGYTDWRIPNIVELQTMIFEAYPSCSVDPCIIDPAFDPTSVAKPYYSSTSRSLALDLVWHVFFGNGFVVDGPTHLKHHVRAVRSVR